MDKHKSSYRNVASCLGEDLASYRESRMEGVESVLADRESPVTDSYR